MGMTCSLHRATPGQIERMAGDPDAIASFLGFEEWGMVRVKQKGLLGILERLLPITTWEAAPQSAALDRSEVPDGVLDIEKAWHGLHFLYTGTAYAGEEPACYLLAGGEPLDDDGHVFLLSPEQVASFATFLGGLTTGELERRYDADRMVDLDIYPAPIWERCEPSVGSPLTWLLGCHESLAAYVRQAASAGDGVVIHLG